MTAAELLAAAAAGGDFATIYGWTEYIGRNGTAYVNLWIVTDDPVEPLEAVRPYGVALARWIYEGLQVDAWHDLSHEAQQKRIKPIVKGLGWSTSYGRIGYRTSGSGYDRRLHVCTAVLSAVAGEYVDPYVAFNMVDL
jgi:hypothetical protein